MHTSSAVQQVTASSAAPNDAPASVPTISMVCHPIVVHDTVANDSHDDSSTGSMDHIVDYVQAIHLNPFDVSLGINYNSTLLEKVNVNWDDEPADPTVPAETDDSCFMMHWIRNR
jgi:hypothetical protein